MPRLLSFSAASSLCRSAAAFVALPTLLLGQKPAGKPAGPPPPPLASLVSEHVIVLPVQLLRIDDATPIDQAKWPAFRKELDDSIGSAISARGIGKKWMYAADVVRSARRNAAYTSDPYSLGAQVLKNAIIKPGDRLPDVIGSNLRTLIALGDSRMAILPIEARFEKKNGLLRVSVRLALVDARAGSFEWIGEASSDWEQAYSPSMLVAIGERVADLAIAR
jgi:hypothetical protein